MIYTEKVNSPILTDKDQPNIIYMYTHKRAGIEVIQELWGERAHTDHL